MNDTFYTRWADVVMVLGVLIVLAGGLGSCCIKMQSNYVGGFNQTCNRNGTCDFPNLHCDGETSRCVLNEAPKR